MNTNSNAAHVVVLGASPKPHRFSHQAVVMLSQKGYRVSPVHPRAEQVAGIPVLSTLDSVPAPIHTVTLYVSPAHLEEQITTLISLTPERVIFNPGSESPAAQQQLTESGIPWVEDCTLVMLRSGNF